MPRLDIDWASAALTPAALRPTPRRCCHADAAAIALANALMDYGAQVLNTASATGARPSGRQGAVRRLHVDGSGRDWLRAVLEHAARPVDELAATLESLLDAVADLVALLERDGLVVVGLGGVRIA